MKTRMGVLVGVFAAAALGQAPQVLLAGQDADAAKARKLVACGVAGTIEDIDLNIAPDGNKIGIKAVLRGTIALLPLSPQDAAGISRPVHLECPKVEGWVFDGIGYKSSEVVKGTEKQLKFGRCSFRRKGEKSWGQEIDEEKVPYVPRENTADRLPAYEFEATIEDALDLAWPYDKSASASESRHRYRFDVWLNAAGCSPIQTVAGVRGQVGLVDGVVAQAPPDLRFAGFMPYADRSEAVRSEEARLCLSKAASMVCLVARTDSKALDRLSMAARMDDETGATARRSLRLVDECCPEVWGRRGIRMILDLLGSMKGPGAIEPPPGRDR